MNSAQKTGLFGLIAVAGFASNAFAVVPWSPSFGNTSLFAYAGGEANDGDFGNPTLSPNTFNFLPPAFFAGGTAAKTNTDTLTVELTVNPGQIITGIRVTEVGTKTAHTSFIAATGYLSVFDFQTQTFLPNELLVTTPMNTTATTWSGEILLTGLNFTAGQKISISMTNNLVVSGTGTARRIDKTGMTVEVLPAPGVLGVAGIAMLGLGRRRRD